MKVAFVTSEVVPFSKSGGLADVSGALPPALRKLGVDVRTITPLHRSSRSHPRETVPIEIEIPMGGRVLRPRITRSGETWFVEHDPFFDREGLYGDSKGAYPDNAARFILFCRAAVALLEKTGAPDLIHAHDWQAGLVPAYARKTKTLFTIHNLAYQGVFASDQYQLTGLDRKHYQWRELEYHGGWSFLKAGIVFSDAITTVSPGYAEEILTESSGMGFHGVLQERKDRLHGILNGIDLVEWDPEKDPFLPARYSAKDRTGKRTCKKKLQWECRLPQNEKIPLVGMVMRFAEQKGLDLLIDALDELMKEDLQLAILGSGEARFQDAFTEAARRHPEKWFTRVGFDNGFAHRIEAGADIFLMPSRFEPCGLNQMYSLRYGTVPIVRATGGLADTVSDGVTGFHFQEYTAEAMLAAVRRAISLYRNREAWDGLITAGMSQDLSWDRSAREYSRLYANLLPEKA